MMQTIHCEICTEGFIPFGGTTVSVTYSTHKSCCEHCNNIQTDKEEHFFCSKKCFKKWVELLILPNACISPSKEDILNILIGVPTYYSRSENFLVESVMRHYKGKCNPALVRQTIQDILAEYVG